VPKKKSQRKKNPPQAKKKKSLHGEKKKKKTGANKKKCGIEGTTHDESKSASGFQKKKKGRMGPKVPETYERGKEGPLGKSQTGKRTVTARSSAVALAGKESGKATPWRGGSSVGKKKGW